MTLRKPIQAEARARSVPVPVALALLLVACGPPVSVRPVAPQDVYRADSASVLDEGEPSRFTRIVIHKAALDETFERNQRLALRALYEQVIADGQREQLLALAELSFLEGQAKGRRSDYLGAAVYAYLYLFADGSRPAGSEWDPRSRIAADIYNRALARAFSSADKKEFVFAAGRRELPAGTLDVRTPRTKLEWPGGVRFGRFLPADVFEVEGLSSRYRRPGLGAPLIAERTLPRSERRRGDLWPPNLEAPATAFLRVEGGMAELRHGTLKATLELYDPVREETVEVDGREIPLEAQTTTAIAHLLGHSRVWSLELAGFLSGDQEVLEPGMYMLDPYEPGKIPVVFVHGTASSPGRWADLYNELMNDPIIGKRYQFWFFSYTTGNPIPYSATLLRRTIRDTVARLDPEDRDPALDEMVVIGHSQGGLLTRMAISDSGDLFWRRVSQVPIDELEIDESTRALLREMMFFEPVPNVQSVVFIATPHRGSFVAGGFLGRLGSRLVSVSTRLLLLPLDVLRAPIALAAKGLGAEEEPELDHVPTAVEGMMPGSGFVQTLAKLPMSPSVDRHSIIAVKGGRPVEEDNDGVVEYASAHLEEVDSEVVIESDHSVQSNPRTVAEIRRILREHLQAVDAADGQTEGAP